MSEPETDLNRDLLRDHKPMRVTPRDRTTFMVCSEAKPGTLYLVDLADPTFKKGRCTCHDFQIRVEAVINRGDRPPYWFCKHVEAVLIWVVRRSRTDGLERQAELPASE